MNATDMFNNLMGVGDNSTSQNSYDRRLGALSGIAESLGLKPAGKERFLAADKAAGERKLQYYPSSSGTTMQPSTVKIMNDWC